MSDYLSNLAARSLNLARVARPRLPSRFEPTSAGVGARGPYSLDAENDEAGRAPETFSSTSHELYARGPDVSASREPLDSDAGGRTTAARRPGGDSSFDSSRRDDEGRSGRSALPRNQNTSFGKSLPDSTEGGESDESTQTPTAGTKGATHVSGIPPSKNDAALDAVESDGGEFIRERDERSLDRGLARLEAESLRRDAESRPSSSSSGRLAARAGSFEPPAPIAPRSVTAHVAAPSSPFETTDAAPRIKITIGRIEVRAVMPPPPPAARPRTASASPSLDEYLKKGERNSR